MATKSGRVISAERSKDWKQIIIKWEVVLFLIFILINIFNSFISPYYMSVNGLFTATSSFLEKAFIVLLLASGRNDHSESGEINQFQPLENSQCTSATPFLS